MNHLAALLFVGCAALTGCGGAMGQVNNAPSRAGDKGGLASSLDAPLAVGGAVRPAFQFTMKGSAAPSTHLISARPDVIDVQNGLLIGKEPGVVAVLVATEDDLVVDFLHVTVRAADRVDVHGFDNAGGDMGPLTEQVEMVVGESTRLVPRAYAQSEQLAGVATSTWTVDPPIAIVLREGLPNRVRLLARQPGEARLKVTMLGTTSTLALKVIQ